MSFKSKIGYSFCEVLTKYHNASIELPGAYKICERTGGRLFERVLIQGGCLFIQIDLKAI